LVLSTIQDQFIFIKYFYKNFLTNFQNFKKKKKKKKKKQRGAGAAKLISKTKM
jgi:hypothetical protein